MLADKANSNRPRGASVSICYQKLPVLAIGLISKRDMAQIVADIRRVVADTRLPSGYRTSLEGTFQAQEEATLLIGGLSLISLTLIFLVLYARYQSVALTAIIMGNVPLALIGSILALWLAGQPLSVASMIGFITLTGISARNGILKISHYINLSLYEGERFGRDLSHAAASNG